MKKVFKTLSRLIFLLLLPLLIAAFFVGAVRGNWVPRYKNSVAREVVTYGQEKPLHISVQKKKVPVRVHTKHFHAYENGVCVDCGDECPHEYHDWNAVCKACGERVWHSFKDGVCTTCGRDLPYIDDGLPDEYLQSAELSGRIDNMMIGYRNVYVYVPDGYDASKKYDVLVFAHGAGGTGKQVMTREIYFGRYGVTIPSVVEHLIADGLVRPTLLVSFDWGGSYNPSALADYLRDELLPLIVSNYSTFAESVEDIPNQRSHFAMGGLSLGSMYTLNTGLSRCLELFGRFLCMGGTYEHRNVIRSLNLDENIESGIYCFIMQVGYNDSEKRTVEPAYYKIVSDVERLVDGDNAFFVSNKGPHAWTTWATGLYDCLPVLFQNESEVA